MSVLTNDRLTPSRAAEYIEVPVRANTIIYSGSLVALITSGTGAGTAVPASDTANRVVLGVADARADNRTGVDGAITVRVAINRAFKLGMFGSFPTPLSSHIGRVVYVADDNKVQLARGTNGIKVGKVLQVDPDGVWVYIIPAPAPIPGLPDLTYDAVERDILNSIITYGV